MRRSGRPIAALAVLVACGAWALAGCETKGGGGAVGTGGGAGVVAGAVCRDSCPKTCTSDNDCSVSDGEVCCSYGGFGKACTKASKCPRLCSADSECDTAEGEICCRSEPFSPEKTCTEAKKCFVGCAKNEDCGEDTVCCLSLPEPWCVEASKCPQTCTSGSDCKGEGNQLCCHSVRSYQVAQYGYSPMPDGGVCLDTDEDTCHTPCATSQDCPEKAPICCSTGFCDDKCEQPCDTNNDCNLSKGEFCCGSQVYRSPLFDD